MAQNNSVLINTETKEPKIAWVVFFVMGEELSCQITTFKETKDKLEAYYKGNEFYHSTVEVRY